MLSFSWSVRTMLRLRDMLTASPRLALINRVPRLIDRFSHEGHVIPVPFWLLPFFMAPAKMPEADSLSCAFHSILNSATVFSLDKAAKTTLALKSGL